MSTHTPGPWKAYKRLHGAIDAPLPREDIWEVAEANPAHPAKPHGITSMMNGLTEANARLIAAAPDLLAALKAILPLADLYEHDNGMPIPYRIAADARAAIAKAEGTS